MPVRYCPLPLLKADPIGSYAGGSIGFNRSESDIPIAADGVYSFSDNFQLRATAGEGIAVVAPTASISRGEWRFAAGAGLEYLRRDVEVGTGFDVDGNPIQEQSSIPTNEDGTPGEAPQQKREETVTETRNETRLVGIAVAERAIGDYGVVFANVTFSNQVRGSIGVGLRF